MVFPPPPGHVSGTNRDWPETWSSGVVAWGRGRPAQSCHRLLHPAVHLLIYQGPLEPVGGTSWEWVGPSLEWETRVEKREAGPGSKVRELQDLRINDSSDRILLLEGYLSPLDTPSVITVLSLVVWKLP